MDNASVILATRYINLGVAYYEKGLTQEAIIAFADSLQMARNIVDDANASKPAMADCYHCHGPFVPQFSQSERRKFPSSDISVFLNPIRIPDKLPCRRISKILSLISLFNLAICNHRNAITQDLDRSLLIKSLQLYQLAYSLQMQDAIDLTLTPTMIIMSNVGHIHNVLGNDEHSVQCFQHLLSTLMFLLDAGEKENVWEFDGLFGNVLKTVYAHPPAPAA